jgi:hypothetical protein
MVTTISTIDEALTGTEELEKFFSFWPKNSTIPFLVGNPVSLEFNHLNALDGLDRHSLLRIHVRGVGRFLG